MVDEKGEMIVPASNGFHPVQYTFHFLSHESVSGCWKREVSIKQQGHIKRFTTYHKNIRHARIVFRNISGKQPNMFLVVIIVLFISWNQDPAIETLQK